MFLPWFTEQGMPTRDASLQLPRAHLHKKQHWEPNRAHMQILKGV